LNIGSGGDIEVFAKANPSADWSIGNEWSISFWYKPKISQSTVVFWMDINIDSPSSNTNSIRVGQGGASNSLAFLISGGAAFSGQTISNIFSLNSWVNITIVRNPAQNPIHSFYINSVLLVPSDFSSYSEFGTTMSNTIRELVYGADNLNTGSSLEANMGHLAMWDSALAASEIDTIQEGGHFIDLRQNSGNYNSSADLVHYYRPGFVDEGFTDEGVKAVPRVDLVDSVNITTDDIVEDAPPFS